MNIFQCFEEVKDYRNDRGKIYYAVSVVKLIVAGLLSNKNTLKSIWRFASSLTEEELKILGFPSKKIPCYSNLTLIVREIDPKSLRRVIEELITYICKMTNIDLKELHIDGKTLRGSNSYGQNEQIQILTAFSSQLNIITGFQEIVDQNESAAMLKLLSEYDIKNKILTGDANFCREKHCEEVIKQGGDFAFTLKGNEPNLHNKLKQIFEKTPKNDPKIRSFEENLDLTHGRIEQRKIEVMNMPFIYSNGFRHIKQICKIHRTRIKKKTGELETEIAFMITSLNKDVSPAQLLILNRKHWSCENNLNWVKDVIFKEDESTVSTGNAPIMMSLLRSITIAIISTISKKITEVREHFNNYRNKLFRIFNYN